MKAFTLVEILVALLVSSVLTITGLHMGNVYLVEWRWQRLKQVFRDEFLDLRYKRDYQVFYPVDSDFSYLAGDVQYHLYFDSVADLDTFWFFVSRSSDMNASDREIIWYEQKSLDLFPIRLGQMLFNGSDTDRILLTWGDAFQRWNIDILDFSILSSGVLAKHFSFSENLCNSGQELCSMNFKFRSNGLSFDRILTLSSRHGLSFRKIL